MKKPVIKKCMMITSFNDRPESCLIQFVQRNDFRTYSIPLLLNNVTFQKKNVGRRRGAALALHRPKILVAWLDHPVHCLPMVLGLNDMSSQFL